jgi:hypothetical protein
MIDNPFTPTFGKSPTYLEGRDTIINDFIEGLNSPNGDPRRSTIYQGARGTGKTVILNAISERAKKCGYVSVNVTALPGMLDMLIEFTIKAASRYIPGEKPKVTGANAAGFGIQLEFPTEKKHSYRFILTSIVEQLEKKGAGLLIGVDEVDPTLGEMKDLVTTFQHLVREEHKIALVMDGLPQYISKILTNKSLSFLRRSRLVNIGNLTPMETRKVLLDTIENKQRAIDEDALELAVKSSEGYPYLIQLIGYHSWKQSDVIQISKKDVEFGIGFAKEELIKDIIGISFDELSDMDRQFLTAMAVDKGKSKMNDIKNRLGIDSNYAAQYRRRLIEAGIIAEAGHGYVAFIVPYMKEYVDSQNEQLI